MASSTENVRLFNYISWILHSSHTHLHTYLPISPTEWLECVAPFMCQPHTQSWDPSLAAWGVLPLRPAKKWGLSQPSKTGARLTNSPYHSLSSPFSFSSYFSYLLKLFCRADMKQIIHFYTFFRGLKSTLHFLWRACTTRQTQWSTYWVYQKWIQRQRQV